MKLLKILAVCFWLVLCAFFYGSILVAQQTPSPSQALGETYTTGMHQDPTLKAYAASMGMNVAHIDLIYSDYKNTDQEGQYNGSDSGTSAAYTITIKPGMDENETRITLAHEYYHYIYWTHEDTFAKLAPHIWDVYNADSLMQTRMQPYIDVHTPEDTFTSELFSIYCTEVSSGQLDDQIEAECNKWVDRSMTTALR